MSWLGQSPHKHALQPLAGVSVHARRSDNQASTIVEWRKGLGDVWIDCRGRARAGCECADQSNLHLKA